MTNKSQNKLSSDHFIYHETLNLSGINHGFFKRTGGKSTGLYNSLNCGPGSDDQPENIQYNRDLVAQTLGCASQHLLSLYQVHSADVVSLTNTPDLNLWNSMNRPRADGLVTNQPGIALGILTADCGPILFADPVARVIGACHAGWNGAFKGVMGNVVTQMEALGAKRNNIRAVLGPCIHQKSYEVGSEFVERFVRQKEENQKYFVASSRVSHSMFDLPRYILDHLTTQEIHSVNIVPKDTKECEDEFFSYRRTTHAQEPDYGRQVSAIALI